MICSTFLSSAAPSSTGLSRGSRILLGTSFFVLSGLAILLGSGCPFWIPLALVIVLLLGSGFASSLDPIQLEPAQKQQQQRDPCPTSQIAVSLSEGLSERVAVFNHLFHFTCEVSESAMREKINGLAAPTAYLPILYFQVYSVDLFSFDRRRLKGYGSMVLPIELTCGSQKQETQLGSHTGAANEGKYFRDGERNSSSGSSNRDSVIATWRPIGALIR